MEKPFYVACFQSHSLRRITTIIPVERITAAFPMGRIAAAFPVGRIPVALPMRGIAIAFFRETIHCARDELAYLPFWKILGRIKFVELYWPADSIEDPMNFHLMGHKAYDLDL